MNIQNWFRNTSSPLSNPRHRRSMSIRRFDQFEHRVYLTPVFSVTLDASGLTSYESEILANLQAAADDWGRFIDSSASIEIVVGMTIPGDGTPRATGYSETSVFAGMSGELFVYQWGSVAELNDPGTDPNGSGPDIRIKFEQNFLDSDVWFSPNPNERFNIPPDKVDGYTVLLHELGHALGINGYYTDGINDSMFVSPFDLLISEGGGEVYFNGTAAVSEYGSPVPLTRGNIRHLGNSTGAGTDIVTDLMNGVTVGLGDLYSISRLDLAILDDVGVPINFNPQDKIAVHRSAKFYQDGNGNNVWNSSTPGDLLFGFGSVTDKPVVGDWNGDGFDDVGIFRSGKFYLDANGNNKWDAPGGGDLLFSFGITSDIPVVGDWNGDGIDDVGIFRNGKWYLDLNGNRTWDNQAGGDGYFSFGIASDLPVAGDWNGDGDDDIGVFRNGKWYLDQNNSRVWNGTSGGDEYHSFGTTGDSPVTGDWNRDGIDDLAVVRSAKWYLDQNGNRSWNGTAGGDTFFSFGSDSDVPLAGRFRQGISTTPSILTPQHSVLSFQTSGDGFGNLPTLEIPAIIDAGLLAPPRRSRTLSTDANQFVPSQNNSEVAKSVNSLPGNLIAKLEELWLDLECGLPK